MHVDTHPTRRDRPPRIGVGLGRTLVVLLVMTTLAVHDAPASADVVVPSSPTLYRLPVTGGVLVPFDAPDQPYGAGHRGIDLDAAVGTVVGAAADGTVSFAGSVAGVTWVTIEHADGVRTSYGPLTDLRVAAGTTVVAGEPLGVVAAGGHGGGDAERGLHLGARRDGRYIDPLGLPGLRLPRPSLVGAGQWWAFDPATTPYEPWGGARFAGLHYHDSPVASAPGWSVPPNPNHVVVVAGLASSSATVPLDPVDIGFASASTTFLSYAGRHDDPIAARIDDPRRDQAPYAPADTWRGVDAAALALRDQLRAQARREPGRAVDLIAHSMGGVVLLHYLTTYHDPYDTSLPPIGHVVTVASPLSGSDLAMLGAELAAHPRLGPGLASLRDALADEEHRLARSMAALPLDAPAVSELATGSGFLAALDAAWRHAIEAGAAGPLATGTRVLTIAGGADRVVGADRASFAPDDVVVPETRGGAVLERQVLPGAHSAVLETEAVREVIRRFLADDDIDASPGTLVTIVSAGVGTALRVTGGLVRLDGAIVSAMPLR